MTPTSCIWLHLLWHNTALSTNAVPRFAANSLAWWDETFELLPILYASTGRTSHCLVMARSDTPPRQVIEALSNGGMMFHLPDGGSIAPPREGECALFPVSPSSVTQIAALLMAQVAAHTAHPG